MHVGVSTSCLFPLETEKSLRRLSDLGIRRTEIFLNSPSEASPAFVRDLRRIADDGGMCVTGVHPYCSDSEGMNFFGCYPRRFSDALDEYRRMFEACAALGAPYLIFHGAKNFPPVSRTLYFERFVLLEQEAARFGVTICQENVARCISHDPAFLREMRENVPSVHFVLDTKQALRAGLDPLTVMEAMGSSLARIHISDATPDCDCVPPGRGEMDFVPLVAHTRALQFMGDWMIELYRWNFSEDQELAQSCGFLEKLFDSEK
jgi:sugar phosphate isomerase/epimerase